GSERNAFPVIWLIWLHTFSGKSGCVFSPVPTAVPPIAKSLICSLLSLIIDCVFSSIRCQPLISCPNVIGVASCKCVLPIFTTLIYVSDFSFIVFFNVSTAGKTVSSNLTTAATCMAVGYVSFELCDLFTSSFGWRRISFPCSFNQSFPTWAITSFTFIFDCVPLPVCQTTNGKCSFN